MRKIWPAAILFFGLLAFFMLRVTAQDAQITGVQDSQVRAQVQPDSCIENQDSISAALKAPVINEPYYNHAKENEIHPQKPSRKPAFLFILIVFQLCLLAYLRKTFPKSLEEMTRALTNLTLAQQLYREQELTMPVSAIFYNINFVFSTGIFLFLLNVHYGWTANETPFVSMLFFLWMVIVLYSLKYGTMKFVALIFPFGNEVNHYNFNFFLAQKVAGIILIPINLLIAYSPASLQSAIIILALIMLAIFIIGVSLKGLEISRNLLQHDAFHYFVYICTLEIAPVCILVKVVVEWLS